MQQEQKKSLRVSQNLRNCLKRAICKSNGCRVGQAASLARISLIRPSLLAGVNKPLSQIRSALWP